MSVPLRVDVTSASRSGTVQIEIDRRDPLTRSPISPPSRRATSARAGRSRSTGRRRRSAPGRRGPGSCGRRTAALAVAATRRCTSPNPWSDLCDFPLRSPKALLGLADARCAVGGQRVVALRSSAVGALCDNRAAQRAVRRRPVRTGPARDAARAAVRRTDDEGLAETEAHRQEAGAEVAQGAPGREARGSEADAVARRVSRAAVAAPARPAFRRAPRRSVDPGNGAQRRPR